MGMTENLSGSLKYSIILPHVGNYTMWPIKEWCYDNIGPRWGIVDDDHYSPKGMWTVLWAGPHKGTLNGYRWHFRREQDLLMFKLRWEQ